MLRTAEEAGTFEGEFCRGGGELSPNLHSCSGSGQRGEGPACQLPLTRQPFVREGRDSSAARTESVIPYFDFSNQKMEFSSAVLIYLVHRRQRYAQCH